jgi:orotidine-5'-phosphate decarboxylase
MDFSDRLIEAIRQKQSRVVVGLDPHIELMPRSILKGVDKKKRSDVARAVERFCLGIIEAIAETAIAVKPQVAFFERLGPAGYEALEAVVAAARGRGLIVISDCKRGDIGSTAAAYAAYHLGLANPTNGELAGLQADAMTVNPYLGEDSLMPFVEFLSKGRGIFILTKTSNPGSGDLQDRLLHDGTRQMALYSAVGELANRLAHRFSIGKFGYSSIGLVVGATHSAQANELRATFPQLIFLIPGVGAQGAMPADVLGCFDKQGLGAVVNASRSIIFAYRDSSAPDRWQESARNAAISLRNELNSAIFGR